MRPRLALLTTCLAVSSALARPGAACELTPARACVVNEDSHPHEVRPGLSADYDVETDRAGQAVFARCMLSGPVSAVRITFTNLTPRGWAARNRGIRVGEPVHIDIEGITTGTGAASFSFHNRDPDRLLWHQCYNG